MVEVFKTTVSNNEEASTIKELLLKELSGIDIHFDLEDCDKILRVEGIDFSVEHIINILNGAGFHCLVLED